MSSEMATRGCNHTQDGLVTGSKKAAEKHGEDNVSKNYRKIM